MLATTGVIGCLEMAAIEDDIEVVDVIDFVAAEDEDEGNEDDPALSLSQ